MRPVIYEPSYTYNKGEGVSHIPRDPVTHNPNIENNLFVAQSFGAMPYDMLTAKFEETNYYNEDDYDDYARRVLTDKGSDKTLFESGEPYRNISGAAGRVQLQYYGHRGYADDPAHPEMFLGFGGPEEHDPRGINTDPDMSKIANESRKRARFQYLSPDMSDHVTGGSRSETQVISDMVKARALANKRLKVFSRELDGRREGLNRVFKQPSRIKLKDITKKYGEFIQDRAMNPRNRAVKISQQIIRDSEAYRLGTLARIDTQPEGCNLRGPGAYKMKSTGVWESKEQAGNFGASSQNAPKKALMILAADLIEQKRTLANLKNSDHESSATGVDTTTKTEIRKTKSRIDKIESLMHQITHDINMSDAGLAAIRRGAHENQAKSNNAANNRADNDDYVESASTYAVNVAVQAYKSVIGGDIGLTRRRAAPDDVEARTFNDAEGRKGGVNKTKYLGDKTLTGTIELDGKSVSTKVYKHLNMKAPGPGSKDVVQEVLNAHHLQTEYRKTGHAQQDTKFAGGRSVQQGEKRRGDNTTLERHGGALGKKYMRKYMERETQDDDLRDK